ncbi:MAG TPA: GDP-mannose 4,6-dehydratase [Verrucomicrobiae bacterium]|nr:GDP-mannose 4,6-dehydratase [Verrucomicrobiae bacterium]
MQRFLITGGAGFIGSHLGEALLAQGKEVFVIDDLSTGSLVNIDHLQSNPKFHFTKGTVLDRTVVGSLMRQVDFTYHLAAAVGVELVVKSPVHTIEANVRGSESVLEEASKCDVGVLLTSTSEVYGKSSKPSFHENDDLLIGRPTLGRWSYACSKLLDEFLAVAYWRERKLPVHIVRLFNTVGPRQTGRYGMVLPRFVQQALRGEPLSIYGDGKQSRCFCHVSDVVRALTELPNHSESIGEVYNIGSTEEITILELAQRIKDATGSQSELRFIPYDQAYAKGFEDMPRRKPSTDKIRRALGWQPTQTLDDIIRRTVEFHRNAASPPR